MGRTTDSKADEPVQPDEAHDYDTDAPEDAQPDYAAELTDEQGGQDK